MKNPEPSESKPTSRQEHRPLNFGNDITVMPDGFVLAESFPPSLQGTVRYMASKGRFPNGRFCKYMDAERKRIAVHKEEAERWLKQNGYIVSPSLPAPAPVVPAAPELLLETQPVKRSGIVAKALDCLLGRHGKQDKPTAPVPAASPIQPAIPTPYRGVTFRTRGEAVFARALDLAGYDDWRYEPESHRIKVPGKGPYVPDFVVNNAKNGGRPPELIIEQKPCAASAEYCTWLAQCFDQYGDDAMCLLCCGSAWDGGTTRSSLLYQGDGMWCEVEQEMHLFEHLDTAKTFRWDLKNGGFALPLS